MRYPDIVSLGGNCQVKEAFLKWQKTLPDFSRDSLHHPGNHLFDWTITGPWELIKLLKNDFSGIFEKGSIVAKDETDGRMNFVKDTGSGILFHHLFTRNNDWTDQATVDAEFDDRAVKVAYLVEKMRAVMNSEHLINFIYRGDIEAVGAEHMIAALDYRRAGRPYTLTNVTYGEPGYDPAAISDKLRTSILPADNSWHLDSWSPVFESICRENESLLKPA